MEDEKLPRREREKIRQRQEVLDAAVRLFSGKGYHNVSMHEIAEASEFAIGTLYKFFRNKEELYKALMMELADRFHAAISAAIEREGDEVEKLRNYVKAKGEVFRANVSTIRLYFAEAQGASFNIRAGLDSKIREMKDQTLQAMSGIFATGMKRKRFNKIAEPYHLAIALESLTNSFLFLWLEAPERHPYPEDPDVILNLLFRGLME
jgi:TetR/AcrR family transcriptional regulator